MAERVILPKQGLQMTEGTITKWLVPEGGTVRSGEPLFEMETDKLTITIDAQRDGTLLRILRDEGETVPITEPIAVIGEPGEDVSGLLGGNAVPAPAEKKREAVPKPDAAAATPPARPAGRTLISPRAGELAKRLGVSAAGLSGSGPEGLIVERDVRQAGEAARVRATPLARKLAQSRGIDLSAVSGSGPRGKIRRDDLPAAGVSPEGRDIRPMSAMRRTIARRMRQSLSENAQATHRVAVRMERAMACRESLKAAGRGVSVGDLVCFAVVRALGENPYMNAEIVGDGVWLKPFVNLGVAVALEDGLVVPVVRDAHRLTLRALSDAIRTLAEGARQGALSPEDYAGGSFTVSNLGMLGLEEFCAIINPPETGILAVGAVTDQPVAENGEVAIRPMLRLTLSYDHRAVDGAPAARFLRSVRDYLENPFLLL